MSDNYTPDEHEDVANVPYSLCVNNSHFTEVKFEKICCSVYSDVLDSFKESNFNEYGEFTGILRNYYKLEECLKESSGNEPIGSCYLFQKRNRRGGVMLREITTENAENLEIFKTGPNFKGEAHSFGDEFTSSEPYFKLRFNLPCDENVYDSELNGPPEKRKSTYGDLALWVADNARAYISMLNNNHDCELEEYWHCRWEGDHGLSERSDSVFVGGIIKNHDKEWGLLISYEDTAKFDVCIRPS